jgi:hypothetical protein
MREREAEQINKAVNVGLDAIVAKVMRDNPGMSRDMAKRKAFDTPEYSQLHRMEKRARLGEGY